MKAVSLTLLALCILFTAIRLLQWLVTGSFPL
jgi:hypothetical protein